jgi:6-pyruvoyltetrahydropterin/6-carboxytetrahydropterin synthase
MYNIRVESHFSAAHNLRGYKGKCEELHGHNWKIEVAVVKDTVDKDGMVMDFTYLKARVAKVLAALDHTYLNNLPYFKKHNPTSENIAKYLYDRLKAQGAGVASVTVWESENSAATYYE